MKNITYSEDRHKKVMDGQYNKGVNKGIEIGERDRDIGLFPFIWGVGLSSIFWLYVLWW
jgi:hypothetical protein